MVTPAPPVDGTRKGKRGVAKPTVAPSVPARQSERVKAKLKKASQNDTSTTSALATTAATIARDPGARKQHITRTATSKDKDPKLVNPSAMPALISLAAEGEVTNPNTDFMEAADKKRALVTDEKTMERSLETGTDLSAPRAVTRKAKGTDIEQTQKPVEEKATTSKENLSGPSTSTGIPSSPRRRTAGARRKAVNPLAQRESEAEGSNTSQAAKAGKRSVKKKGKITLAVSEDRKLVVRIPGRRDPQLEAE